MPYQHLSISDRETISQMHYSGCTHSEIARELGRSPSTISREFSRNGSGASYSAVEAQKSTEQRRRDRPFERKLDQPELNETVRHRLTQEWSPEQISGHQREQFPSDPHRHISHQTIYEWLANHCEYRAHFESFLRHGRYGKRKTGPKPVGVIRNRVSISERPSIVSDKGRLGDWEGDTVVGSGHHGSIATMVERLSGYLCAGLMPNGRSASLNRATHRIMSKLPSDLLRTLTVDNGVEFAKHEALARKLSIEIYFADPYCSNQRALNENTNGLLRQYFPKGSNFLELSHVALARAVTRLNNRPRKRLGYQNPLEFLVRAGFALQN